MRRAHAAGAALSLSVAALFGFGAAPASAQDSAPSITVTQTPGPGEAGCLPAQEGTTASITQTDTEVIMTITARFPVCGPVTAAVYAMPDNRAFPWPQSKRESETFTIGTGLTVVRFTKGCEPQQFDLVTGDTPQTIRPDTGPMHGPLVSALPWSYTGVQNWGECVSNTTTTSTTTTQPTGSSSTTSTTTTTVLVGGTSTIPTTTVAVGGINQVRDPGSGTSGGSTLATTGTDVSLLARLAVILLALGGVLALTGGMREAARRRQLLPLPSQRPQRPQATWSVGD